MPFGELIVGLFGGVAAAIVGGHVAHRYSEQLAAEDRRIKTNNVLRSVATEIKIVGDLYRHKFKRVFDECPKYFPQIDEATNGIDSFRHNLELITSQIESPQLVAQIIEMDQLWRLLSAEFRINNRYHMGFIEAKSDSEKERLAFQLQAQANEIKGCYARLEKQAADVLGGIDTYLANSQRTPIQLIPREWYEP